MSGFVSSLLDEQCSSDCSLRL